MRPDYPFSMLPHEFIDTHLKELKGSKFQLLLAVYWKTLGWKKYSACVRAPQFCTNKAVVQGVGSPQVNSPIIIGLLNTLGGDYA